MRRKRRKSKRSRRGRRMKGDLSQGESNSNWMNPCDAAARRSRCWERPWGFARFISQTPPPRPLKGGAPRRKTAGKSRSVCALLATSMSAHTHKHTHTHTCRQVCVLGDIRGSKDTRLSPHRRCATLCSSVLPPLQLFC